MRDFTEGLNPAQREAVTTLQGPLLVLAGAGTGKTRVVTHRIAALIRHGTAPQQILGVTFTNKAAAEMQQRVGRLLAGKVAAGARPVIATFHALCLQILRRHITRLGYPAGFAIYDWGDQMSLARAALREICIPTAALRSGDLLALVSQWKNKGISPAEAARLATSDREHLAAVAYRRYQQKLKLSGAVDFDDLLGLTEALFERFDDVRGEEADRFSHLLVDEYQDTNASQYRILRALAQGHRNLCVVGDDDQAIYGWRGAEVTHILRFKRDWPDARVVRLEENYRSTGPILEMANRLITFNRQRHPKALRAARCGGTAPRILQLADETAEARFVVGEIQAELRTGQTAPRDFAILFRTNEQTQPFETELRRRKIPYVVLGGTSFYDRTEVRDVAAYLRLLSSPKDDQSLLRVINKPERGIGVKTVQSAMAQATRQGRPVWEVLSHMAENGSLSRQPAAAVGQFLQMVQRYRSRLAGAASLHSVVQELLAEIDYQAYLHKEHSNVQQQDLRWRAVEELVEGLARFERENPAAGLAAFVDELALGQFDSDDKDDALKRSAVVLLTLHSAKGLEFSRVYMVGMEENLLPHKRSIELDAVDEERRLCYVGLTRAQDQLTLTLATHRTKWGQPRPTVPSRFLFEMTGRTPPRKPAAKPAGKKTGRTARRRP